MRRGRYAPHRLRMARDLAGVSQGILADAADVSVASISLYERGGAIPSDAKLATFAAHLDVGVEFFYSSTTSPNTPAFFRSLRATKSVDRRRARHKIEVIYELVKALEKVVRLPEREVPEYPVSETQEGGPGMAARRTRQDWDLPPGPIRNVIRSVERRGVIVAQPQEDNPQIDAYSVNYPDRPIIAMSLAKGKHDRCRFDVAHELGHLVMHEPADAVSPLAERQADQFAAEYLMPREHIEADLRAAETLSALLHLKRKWRVSLAALIRRRYDLKIIDKARYTYYMKTISARGWRRHEPVDLGKPETPILLTRAMQLANLTERDLAQHTGYTVGLIQTVLNSTPDVRPHVRI